MKKLFYFLLTAALLLEAGCQKDDSMIEQQRINAENIDAYIDALTYNPDEMLRVQSVKSGSSETETTGTDNLGSTISGGNKTTCVKDNYSLKSNFEDVAILRPTNGVVFPGALVYGDSSLLDGNPTPLAISRSPVQLRLDLPGIGEAGNITVDDPDNTTVQAAIDNALDYWNNNAYQEGYVNPAYVSYKASTSYSSQQLALSLGLNVEWMGNEVAGQFDYTSTSIKKVAMMAFKQGFYSVTMNTPKTPSEVFGKDVTVEKVQSIINNTTPPAYVQSVVYGRIILFRMESNYQTSSTEMEQALQYAAGVTTITGSTEEKIKNILANSSTTVVLIGGNASVATEAVTAKNFGDLQNVIKGDNAVYSKSNPGVPIAYTIKYLKNNTLAKMGYTTDYSIQRCQQSLVPGATFSLFCEAGYVARFTVSYTNKDGKSVSSGSGDIPLGQTKKYSVPAGGHNISFDVDYFTGFYWHDLKSYNYNLPEQHCFKVWGTVFSPQIGTISCN